MVMKRKISKSIGQKGKNASSRAAKAVVKAEKAVLSKIGNKTRKGWAPGLFQGIGENVGSWLMPAGGGGVGRKVGQWFANITGSGSYHLNRNSLLSTNGEQIPIFSRGGTNGTRIRHREYLQDITTPGATFTNLSFSLNPGLPGSFPWLAQIAPNYEEYKFHGLIFEFKSTSADALNSTNTALGTVVLATEYDVLDSKFANKQQMEAYEFSVSTRPSCSTIHPVECDPRQNVMNELFVRQGSPPSGSDLRLYDVGLFQLATVGMQASANIGELWVSYDIEFFKPKLPVPLGAQIISAHYTGVPTSSDPFGTSLQKSGSSMTLTISTGSFTIPFLGRYIIEYYASVATSYTSAGNLTAGTGTTGVATMYKGTNNAVATGSGGAEFICLMACDVNTAGGTVTMATPAVVGAGTFDLIVTQISSGLAVPSKEEEESLALDKRINILLEERLAQMSSLLGNLKAYDDYISVTPEAPPSTPANSDLGSGKLLPPIGRIPFPKHINPYIN